MHGLRKQKLVKFFFYSKVYWVNNGQCLPNAYIIGSLLAQQSMLSGVFFYNSEFQPSPVGIQQDLIE